MQNILSGKFFLSGVSFLSCLFFISACGVYTFTGTQIDPNLKTFNVRYIPNQAAIVVPSLSQTFTDALRNKILTNSNLNLSESGSDIEFSGAIITYSVNPVATQANETAALNRLTISVSIEYINHQDDKKNWSSSFSRYTDYSSSTDLASVQDQLIKEITDQLVEDIFNKAFVNW